MSEVVFSEEEIRGAGEHILKCAKSAEELLTAYKDIMQKVCERSIKSGYLHNALLVLNQIISTENNVAEVGDNVNCNLNDFIGDVDNAEGFIY